MRKPPPKKAKKPKKVAYRLIERSSTAGLALYRVVDELIGLFHEDLKDARIALAWNLSWEPDVDGRLTLGKCKKATELDRELVDFDFVIILHQGFFEDAQVNDTQRKALIDHELCHAAMQYDADGEPVIDERGRICYRIRKHDLEEFSEIAARYGCWKRDIEHFANALERARLQSGDWIGFTRVQSALQEAGLEVPLETIRTWNESERREAQLWAVLTRDLKSKTVKAMLGAGTSVETVMPPHVAAALPATGSDQPTAH